MYLDNKSFQFSAGSPEHPRARPHLPGAAVGRRAVQRQDGRRLWLHLGYRPGDLLRGLLLREAQQQDGRLPGDYLI